MAMTSEMSFGPTKRFCGTRLAVSALAPFFAILLYVLPMSLGYGWNALPGPRPLNASPINSRLPKVPITAEGWGAAVIVVPFEAKLSQCIKKLELPLWNPFQGLGQPFAAQAEGCPFSPLAVVRCAVPPAHRNIVTISYFAISSAFLFSFARRLGLSQEASVFLSASFLSSTILSFHICRHNIADQYSLIPILGWATITAIQCKHGPRYVALSLCVLLTVIGGFLQTATLSIVIATILGTIGIASSVSRTPWERSQAVLKLLISVVIGIGLSAPFLFLFYEILNTGFYRNMPSQMHLANPSAYNLFAFFMPTLLGEPLRQGYFDRGGEWWPVDWSNLFATSSASVLFLCAIGAFATHWADENRRRLFFVAFTCGMVCILRYFGWIPFRLLNSLPILGSMTPKHGNSVTAFIFLLAGGLALDEVKCWRFRRVAVIAGIVVLLQIGAVFQAASEAQTRFPYLPWSIYSISVSSVLLTAILSATLLFCATRRDEQFAKLAISLCAVSEMSFYFPLGVASDSITWLRFAVAIVGCFAAVLLAIRSVALTGVALLTAAFLYAAVILQAGPGLPLKSDVEATPSALKQLRLKAGNEHRSFGVFPEFSCIAQVQDLGIIGPFTTSEFAAFVSVVGDQSVYDGMKHVVFMLAGLPHGKFPFDLYRNRKPIFDWLGVRFLVLDGAFFDNRKLILDTFDENDGVSISYNDEAATILESHAALSKAIFYSEYHVASSQIEILDRLRRNPASIFGTPWIESSQAPNDIGVSGVDYSQHAPAVMRPAQVTSYRNNEVRVAIDTNAQGLLVLKDSYYNGWSATIDGANAPVVRVNGIVRGVFIREPGYHVVVFRYCPSSFIYGLLLSTVTVVCVAAGILVRRFNLITNLGLLGLESALATAILIGNAFAMHTLGKPDAASRSAGNGVLVVNDMREVESLTTVPIMGKELGFRVVKGRMIYVPAFKSSGKDQRLTVGHLYIDKEQVLRQMDADGVTRVLCPKENQTAVFVNPSDSKVTGVGRFCGGRWKVKADLDVPQLKRLTELIQESTLVVDAVDSIVTCLLDGQLDIQQQE